MFSINVVSIDPTACFAAEELKKYLRMLMPRCGEIPITYDPATGQGFDLALMGDIGLDMSDAEDPALDDIVYIEADHHGGLIAGSNPGALLIAVYRYLRFCGCRWLFPGVDGEWIPIIDTLPQVSYRKLADYRYRGQCNEGAEFQQNMLETIDFTPKIGLNTYMLEFDNPYTYYRSYYDHRLNTVRRPEPVDPDTTLQWKRQCETEIKKRSLKFHDMGHGWTAEPFGISSKGGWSTQDESTVPENSRQYLAMIDGHRQLFKGIPLNTNVCMSNPEARRIMVHAIADYAETQNNVDFLHVWMGDGSNNHCECENCRKRTPSDWYVILLNEIDAELTRRDLKTHLVFIVYVDSFWAPITERLHNQRRFTMLFAPITRLYTETYDKTPDMSKLMPYNRNKNVFPRGMSEVLAYLNKWQEIWKGDCISYEYHFCIHQYYDPSCLFLSRLVYDDIKALKKNRLKGIIEDCTQRNYFPHGFPFYVYGETLFDSSVSYEALTEDYFSHAYGKDWRLAVDYLTKVRDHLDYAFIVGLRSADTTKGKHYSPEYAKQFAEIPSITAAFKPIIERNLIQKYRSSTEAWQLLAEDADYLNGLADVLIPLCQGNKEAAARARDKLNNDFSGREIYIERYYDHYFAAYLLNELMK